MVGWKSELETMHRVEIAADCIEAIREGFRIVDLVLIVEIFGTFVRLVTASEPFVFTASVEASCFAAKLLEGELIGTLGRRLTS